MEALQRRWVACTQALVNEHRSLSQHQQQQQEQKKPVVAADNTAKLARVREGWAQINSTAVATQTGHGTCLRKRACVFMLVKTCATGPMILAPTQCSP